MTEYVASNALVTATTIEQSRMSAFDSSRSRPVSATIVSTLAAAAEAIAVLGVGVAALMADGGAIAPPDREFAAVVTLLAALLLINLGYMAGAYRFETLRRPRRAIAIAAPGWIASAVIVGAVLQLGDIGLAKDNFWACEWLVGALALLVGLRLALGQLFSRWSRAGRLTRYVAIFGSGAMAERIVRRLEDTTDRAVSVVGVYEDRHRQNVDRCADIPIRGSVEDLVFDIRRQRIDTVIVSLPLTADDRLSHVIETLRQTPVTVSLCPEWFDMRAGACPPAELCGVPLLRAAEPPLRDWHGIAKAVEDRVLAALILLMISPILAAVAVLIKLDSPGPVLFRQKRYGFNNELIQVFKFRSMYHHKADANAEQLTKRNDPRVTKIGAFLRRTSLDELPQFLNVLRGEMSIVGPRPHALAAKAGGVLYPDAVRFYHSRHRVKPGITGWAQVNGWRGETETVEQIVKRVEHDLYYVEHWSILFDLRIILRTVLGGFTGRHAY